MKKKMVLRLLSLAMVASMTGTMLPSNLQIVSAEDAVVAEEKTEKAEETTVLEDGINDKWTQENKVGEDAVCAVEDGWLHLKSGAQNDNTPSSGKQLMVVNPNTFDFTKAGYFSFTMKSNNANTNQDNSDRFGVYLGYNTAKNGMFIGYDNQGWFWQKYKDGDGAYFTGNRTAAPKDNAEVNVRIEWTADQKMTLKLNDQAVFTNEEFASIKDVLGSQIAFKCTSWSGHVSDVLIKDIHYTGQKEAATYAVTGTVTDADNKALEGATVKVGDKTATTDKSGAYSLELAAGTYDMTVAKTGYQTVTKSVTVTDKDLTVEAVKLEKVAEVETEVLSTDYMDVHVAKNFPSVVRYEMKKGDLKEKTFYGQTSEINTIRINGTDIKLSKDDVKATFKGNKATYELTVKSGDTIDAVLTAELVAKDDTVSFEITKVKNNLDETKIVDKRHVYAIQSIEIPNHSLISVNSTQENANLKGALMSSNTTISGDEYHEITADTELSQDYMYAFISNSEMSAGLWSNSENEGSAKAVGVSGGSHNTRVMATTEEKEGYVSLGLGSTKWYWHREEQDSKGTWHLVDETDTPQAKVTIAGNVNGDEEIDWQDGAVAFRDIMHNPYKSEEVPELVAYRIAMNFGGQAQNPFLTTLDNVKRVAMHTDGLGQSVLLKGYGNEGHDSGHPDYADIGERIGGAEDMNTLMTKGAEYGAKFGIHVNAGEMYPEAKAFSEDLVRRDAEGNLRYGWNWIDQGIGIDSVYDLGMGLREKRFDELEEKVGQNLDFVYVDIWGNKTGGSDDSWQTRKLSKEINDNGWRMATEWGSANEYDSTFQHWATDLTYGGYKLKGENSEVMRFLRNHQKDSWVGDYPSYGGAAMAPLLGGYNMKDFEGWQGRNDYDAYIKNLYTHDLTTKFIQHYEIIDWEDSENSFTKNNPDKQAYTWTPEMKITLKDGDDTLILERGSDNPDEAAYRDRTMTLNGKVIATGAVARGDNGEGGTEKYLLPWIWDSETGDEVDAKDEKLYHWNTKGGTSEWELPDSWSGLKDVKVYKLTDLGKTDEKTVKVVDGKITLEADAETPYVVCKGDEANLEITWSEGMHIVDAGFNSGNFDAWKQDGDGKAEIAKSQYSNPMMKLSGKVSMTQELTDLEAGKQYAVLVGVDNRSDAKASMTVKAGDKVLATNYTTRSIAKNYVKAYTHSNSSATVDGSSYFQNMYVFFTAPESGKVTLTLEKAAGEGDTYFDDVRIVENDSKNITTNDEGEVVKFEQDFEKSVQGLYPFVVAGIEGVEDNRIHLSELHAPYTQAGWDVKKMDDVLDGKWSVKINGLTQRSTLAYQTIPQNFRFEPGVTYKVSFDYQAGSEGIYAAAVGIGEYNGNVQLEELPMAMGKDADGHYTTQITGDSTGQTWFGIYSTDKAPDLQGAQGSAQNFGGYKELVLDNLVIERVEEDVTEDSLKGLLKEAEGKYNEADYTPEVWNNFQKELAKARVALDKDNSTPEDIEKAYYALKAAMVTMDNSKGLDATDDSRDISTEGMTATAGSEQSQTGSEGPASNVLDGDENTIWHTVWAGTPIENHWIDIATAEPTTVGGVRLQQRSSKNGVIKEAQIWVKTTDAANNAKETDAEGYVKVADASFGGSGWQVVTFEDVENVTNVKIKPTATLGDTPNKFSAAAEIRLMGAKQEVEFEVDKTGLKEAIKAAKDLSAEDYTPDTYKVLLDKIKEAEKVDADEAATDYDVLLAIANLEEAIEGLVAVERPEAGDKTALNDLIAQYSGLNAKDYTAESWKTFADALENAKAVAAKENASQGEINQAVARLTAAHAGLVKATDETTKADKSKLQKFYDECVAYYKEANHSKANWKAYQEALATAKAVLADGNATQKEVDSALEKLIDITAKMNAELKDSSKAPKNPLTGKDNVVKTGDATSPIAWTVAGLAAVLAVVAAFFARKRKNTR
ncbi:MAG: endo-alpha-N-acetylgalactosaminidase family protein [Faecalimonas sp.]|nr:endo-alpha-N-acetylgalactosaminidase family protein [Faecalimonas sp.]